MRLVGSFGKAANDLRLAIAANVPVARERRHHLIMPEILRPGLVFLGCFANAAPQKCQRLPKGVGIKVRKSGRRECLPEYLPDRTGAAPVLAVQPRCRKPEIVVQHYLGSWEQRIVQPPELFR